MTRELAAALLCVAIAARVATAQSRASERLRFGATVLVEDQVSLVRGRRVLWVTDSVAMDERGRPASERRAADAKWRAARVTTAAEWHPGDDITIDRAAGVIDSLATNVNAIVVDLVDEGTRGPAVRALAGVLQAAARRNVGVVVLDRPNPITGENPDGLATDSASVASDALYGLPLRHGMTIGEIAKWYVASARLAVPLDVVPVRGWRRSTWPSDAGVRMRGPSRARSDEARIWTVVAAPLRAAGFFVDVDEAGRDATVGVAGLDARGAADAIADRLIPGLSVKATRMAGPQGDVPAIRLSLQGRDAPAASRLVSVVVWAVSRATSPPPPLNDAAFDAAVGVRGALARLRGTADPDAPVDAALARTIAFRRAVRLVLLYR